MKPPIEAVVTAELAKLHERITEWTKKLVDLTRRNRLLYFKSTRSSTLQIVEPTMEEVFNRLVINDKPWHFYIPPDNAIAPKDQPNQSTLEQVLNRETPHNTSPLVYQKETEQTPKERAATELKCVSENPVEDVLSNLYRRAHTEFEERGIRILHVTFGALEWSEQPQSDRIKSPLLLVPVELRRESASQPFELQLAEDEIILNPALSTQFMNEFRIELPEPSDWESPVGLQTYFNEIEQSIAGMNFTISKECWIGLFSFYKLPIYNDLKEHEAIIVQNKLVRALGGIDHVDPAELVDPKELDTKVEPQQSLIVLDADSSQLACIESIKMGSHLVVQGPPGTGKSQTIVNLIAEFVSRGKSVLFVSEKMAALEVVYKRLRDRGLGHLCLELHSNKANKRVVVETLYNSCLENVEAKGSPMSENDFRKLEFKRAELNRYVELLHHRQQPLGLSAFQVLGELARLNRYPTLSSGRGDPGNLTSDQVEQAVNLANRLTSVWSVALQGDNVPWRGCTSNKYSMELRAQILASLTSCLKATEALERDASQIAALFGLPNPKSPSDLWILEAGRMLQECPGVPRTLLTTKGDLYQNLRYARQSEERWEYASIAGDYERGIIELDLPRLIRLWQSPLRSINPHFYIARSRLRKLRVHKIPTQDYLKDLKMALRLKQAIDWAQHFRSKVPVQITSEFLQIAENGSASAPSLTQLENSTRNHNKALTSLTAFFEPGYPKTQGIYLGATPFQLQQTHFALMIEFIDSLRDWIDYRNIEKQFADLRLHALFKALENRPGRSDELDAIVRKSLLQEWIDWLFAKEPLLGQFRCMEHERLISEFRELDTEQWKLGPYRVIYGAAKFKPPISTYPDSEFDVLRREALKKRRHLPLRKLFPMISNLLLRIKPCLLMSPLSVSQFLDPDRFVFDLIIFDEASQVRTEDSIGAIYRGRQVVVCGDDKQLPPTSFFEGILSDEYYETTEDTFEEYESILQALTAAGATPSMLRWHYRSKHESLIAFSNHQFYGDKLVTFPSAVDSSSDLGVKFVYVPNGVYDRGGRRDNRIEAEKVIDLVVSHLENSPDKSLGVVSFSLSQSNTIEDLVEKMRKEHPEFEKFFAEDRLEGFFVKNLENVQGDERDVMIFSVGYGRDPQGRLTMHFGPLNREGGQRRLNVAITRAREKVFLVSSIKAQDFDLTQVNAPGVLQLHKYLQYAEQGASTLESIGKSGGGYESPLEAKVADEIRNLGYEVRAQVGCSGYRIDLGVLDPARPGKFILGVECDGATYHSAYTARDRDRIRQEALKRLGWRIHRVWAPDFVTRHDLEVQRLNEAIEEARDSSPQTPQQASEEDGKKPETPSLSLSFLTPNLTEQNSNGNSDWATYYRIHVPPFRPPWNLQFHDAPRTLSKQLIEIVDNEGPIHVDNASRRLAQTWGLQRVGKRMSEAADVAIRIALRSNRILRTGDFLYSTKDQPLRVRKPNPSNRDTFRNLTQIPPEEIELAFTKILQESLSIPRGTLIVQTARIFGIDRVSGETQQSLDQLLDRLISGGAITQREDRLSLAAVRA
jgi:very-short-patch-repair endonuclease/DNA polymerase III delta prime subunit